MTALVADRQTYTAVPGFRSFPVADNVVIYEGAMIAIDVTGYARPARLTAPSTGDTVIGIAFRRADNTITGHVAGGIQVQVRDNDVAFMNSGTTSDLITNISVGLPCYVIDDNTVGLTNAGGTTRTTAGNIYWVNETGQVGVKFTK
jgi:hypothetical protein